MKKGPFKMKMKQYGQGRNPITRKDVTGDGVYTKKDLLVERGVPGFEKGMDNNKKSPAELGRLKGAFGGALSMLGLGRKKSSSSSSGGRRGFGGGLISSLGSLGGKKGMRPMGFLQGVTMNKRPKNTVGMVARGAANLFSKIGKRR